MHVALPFNVGAPRHLDFNAIQLVIPLSLMRGDPMSRLGMLDFLIGLHLPVFLDPLLSFPLHFLYLLLPHFLEMVLVD